MPRWPDGHAGTRTRDAAAGQRARPPSSTENRQGSARRRDACRDWPADRGSALREIRRFEIARERGEHA
jgi:hypothetical protein